LNAGVREIDTPNQKIQVSYLQSTANLVINDNKKKEITDIYDDIKKDDTVDMYTENGDGKEVENEGIYIYIYMYIYINMYVCIYI
jgi:hypothetical protein